MKCKQCGCKFSPNDFDGIDDEFNEAFPCCPDCQEGNRLEKESCEYCDQPATHETPDGYFCDDHYDEYAEHISGRVE